MSIFGVSFDYLRFGRVSPGVFLEYFLSISLLTPKSRKIVFFEYFRGYFYFTEYSAFPHCKISGFVGFQKFQGVQGLHRFQGSDSGFQGFQGFQDSKDSMDARDSRGFKIPGP